MPQLGQIKLHAGRNSMRPVFHFSGPTILACEAQRVTWARFRRRGKTLVCEQTASQPWPSVTAPTENAWLEQTASTLRTLSAPPGPVILLLPAERVYAKMLTLPPAKRAACEQIIRFELGQSLPGPLTELVWACESGKVPAANPGPANSTLVVAKLSVVESLCQVAETAGFVPQAVCAEPWAWRQAWAGAEFAPTALAPTLFVRAGDKSTIFWLRAAGRWSLRVTGANVAAEALAREIDRTGGFFQAQCGGARPERVVLHTDTAGLAESLTAQTTLPVSRWPEEAETALSGAVRWAQSSLKRTTDLLPPGRRAALDRRWRQPWLVVAALLAMAACLPPVVRARRELNQAQAETRRWEQALVPLRAQAEQMDRDLRRLADARTEIARWHAVEVARTRWLRLLADWQTCLATTGDSWLERVQAAPAEGPGPARWTVAGCLLDRAQPQSVGGAAVLARAQGLRAQFVEVSRDAKLLEEHYDTSQPGRLRFAWVFAAASDAGPF